MTVLLHLAIVVVHAAFLAWHAYYVNHSDSAVPQAHALNTLNLAAPPNAFIERVEVKQEIPRGDGTVLDMSSMASQNNALMATSLHDFAVFTELSLSMKQMKPSWNRRVFNTVDVLEGGSISMGDDGTIFLKQGVYEVSGFSIATFINLKAPNASTASSRMPGYAVLRDAKTGKFLSTASISNALYTLPSIFNTYVDVGYDGLSLVLEHQVLIPNSEQGMVWLQVDANGSSNHAFARISIRRLGD